MSMSSGELTVEGTVARLEFQLPWYEIEHLDEPERSLLDSFSIRVNQIKAARTSGHCVRREEDETYRCEAEYELPSEPTVLEVECNLAESTVPNHVHILRTKIGDTSEQKVFDYTFRRHQIRFRAQTWVESFVSQAGAGALRVLLGPAQLLFLAGLALAGRTRRETLYVGGAFLLAQSITALLLPVVEWQPPARFVEAAGALTVAYLATEILLLPGAGARWLVAGGMGVFHGLYFGLFIRTAEMDALRVLAGASAAGVALLALFAVLAWRLRKDFGEKLFTRASAGLLLAVSLTWFATIVWI